MTTFYKISMGMMLRCLASRALCVSMSCASEVSGEPNIRADMTARADVSFLSMINFLFAVVLFVADFFHPDNIFSVFHSRYDEVRHCRSG